LGIAYLPDGTRIDYNEYIRKHPRWQSVKKARFDFDEGRCVVCHKDLHGEAYQTHHLHYQRLGHERLRDVITLCDGCHKAFHESWHRSPFWTGKEAGHWETYSIHHTARLCAAYWREDRLINRNPESKNLCGREACRDLIDDYYRDFNITKPAVIDPNDISLFIRNKRYELFFEAEKNGKTVEEFLDDYYGPKIRGKNPLRQEAGKKNGPFDHTPESLHRHYSENKNIILLMDEVAAIEAAKTEESKITF
jgi:hypothetical protein